MILTLLAVGWMPQSSAQTQAEPATSTVETSLVPYRAEYEVHRNGKKIGELTATLSQDANDSTLWRYRLESKATDWLVRMLGISTLERSVFEWHEGRIRPLFYRMDSREPGPDRHWQHRYDWADKQTVTETHDSDLNIELSDDALDPLTLRLAMAQLDPTEHATESWIFNVVERDEVEAQTIQLIGQPRLEIGDSCFETFQLYRFRREGSSRNYHAWHAPALNGLPVKVRHDDDNDVIELRLSHWQFDDDSIANANQFNCNVINTDGS